MPSGEGAGRCEQGVTPVEPDITINVNLPSGGAASHSAAQGLASGGDAPPPMAFEQLGQTGSGGDGAPAPQSVSALSGGFTSGDTASPPPPMAVESLSAAQVSEAPSPEAFGTLQSQGAAPAPSLDQVAVGQAEAPAPMSPDDLQALDDEGKGGSKKK